MLALAPDLVSRAAMTEPGYTGPLDDAGGGRFSRAASALSRPTASSATPRRFKRRDMPPSPAFLDAIERQIDDGAESDRMS
jgi:hypothetical protein